MRVRIGLCTRSYVATFDEEEVDPDTLIMVLQQQGRAALDEALQQLGYFIAALEKPEFAAQRSRRLLRRPVQPWSPIGLVGLMGPWSL